MDGSSIKDLIEQTFASVTRREASNRSLNEFRTLESPGDRIATLPNAWIAKSARVDRCVVTARVIQATLESGARTTPSRAERITSSVVPLVSKAFALDGSGTAVLWVTLGICHVTGRAWVSKSAL
jgi:hypothetical protein